MQPLYRPGSRKPKIAYHPEMEDGLKIEARAFLFGLFVAASSLHAASHARADAIDGMWCKGSRSMQIDGPAIVTPGGTSMTGDYDRHGFRYVVPAGEGGAGKTVNMVLLSDYDLDVIVEEGPTERWRRCKLTS